MIECQYYKRWFLNMIAGCVSLTSLQSVSLGWFPAGKRTAKPHNICSVTLHLSDVCLWDCECVLLPLKSLCSRCLQSEGSWVATFRSRHTADSETRDTTSSSRNTRSSSSGGRTARPNRAGRPSAAHTNSRQTLRTDTVTSVNALREE